MTTEQGLSPEQRAQYNSQAEQLDAIKLENQRLLARNTLIISGGAFTLSMALLKDIYTSPLEWSKWFLAASWLIFGLCGFLQFYSDHLSCRAMDLQRQALDDLYFKDDKSAPARPNPAAGQVQRINAATPWLIALGFACVVTFGMANFLGK